MKYIYILIENDMKPAVENGKDVLLHKSKSIPLQDLVKKYLNNPNTFSPGEHNIQIAKKKFRFQATEHLKILEYYPINNGTKPSNHIEEYSQQRQKSNTSFGQRWFNQQPLSPQKKEEVKKKDKEQRENRQHIGDSPKAT